MSEIPFYSITWCKLTYKLMLIQNETFSYCIWNQQSEYNVFDKLQGWLWAKPVDVLVWCGPLLRGDLVRRITGQLTNVVSVFVRRYPMEWGRVRGSSEFLVLYGAWHFWRGWLLAQMKLPRSSRITTLVTYRGVPTIVRSILDWHLCMIAVLD
jgi:hypothetical protein